MKHLLVGQLQNRVNGVGTMSGCRACGIVVKSGQGPLGVLTSMVDSTGLDEFLPIDLMLQGYLVSVQKPLVTATSAALADALLTHETLILQSIETVKVDGSGRHTFPGVFLEDEDPIGLTVFENAFFWANQTQLVRTSPSSLKDREVLLHASHASVSALSVLHRSQQPKSK